MRDNPAAVVHEQAAVESEKAAVKLPAPVQKEQTQAKV